MADLIAVLDANVLYAMSLCDTLLRSAAIHGNAHTIVTMNLRDFPDTALQPYGIEVQHPGAFLIELYALDAATVVRAIRQQVAALRNPAMSAPEVLDTLALHVPDFVSHIRPAVTASQGT
jgi:hypothetical protein